MASLLTHEKYREICSFLSKNRIKTIRASCISNCGKDDKFICVKHDVECNPESALEIALIENKFGISSTFYFQANLVPNNHKLINYIVSLGHEVGYHYDVLDASDGDFSIANDQFKAALNDFKQAGVDIICVCPHGNPTKIRNGWNSNKDYFRKPITRKLFPNIFDTVIDKDLNGRRVAYISDAGYSFKLIFDVTQNDRVVTVDKSLTSLDGLLNEISYYDQLILSTHPHRWHRSALVANIRFVIFGALKYIANRFIYVPGGKAILNKFYALAKRF
jgi:hypothetical protein